MDGVFNIHLYIYMKMQYIQAVLCAQKIEVIIPSTYWSIPLLYRHPREINCKPSFIRGILIIHILTIFSICENPISENSYLKNSKSVPKMINVAKLKHWWIRDGIQYLLDWHEKPEPQHTWLVGCRSKRLWCRARGLSILAVYGGSTKRLVGSASEPPAGTRLLLLLLERLWGRLGGLQERVYSV